jgi:hypothetical protein
MSETSLITIYQPIFPITHAGARKIVAKVGNMESGRSMLIEQAVFIDPVAKYLKHLVAESSKPLPALGLMLDCRLKFNCLITGAIIFLRRRLT